MSGFLGKFVWYELMTSDMAAAETFYKSVVGWSARDASHTDVAYTTFLVGETRVAGLLTVPESAKAGGARPFWMGWVAVDDVDAYCAKFTDAGGKVWKGAADIPDVGRLAVVADPQGAPLVLFKPLPHIGSMPDDLGDVPGVFNWRELLASDWVSAFDFYEEVFGWTKDRAYDMGDFGVYQLFSTADGEPVGGMMTKMQNTPMPFWNFYIHVDSIKAAVERLQAGGGTLVNGPNQVPTGSWTAQCLDPQGAVFCIVSPQV